MAWFESFRARNAPTHMEGALSLFVESLEPRLMLSTVDIYASGSTGQESMQLLVDDQVVATFESVRNIDSGVFDHYRFETSETVTADQISVRFTNDLWNPALGIDRNLIVDKIVIDQVAYQAEDNATFVSSFWDNGIVSGNLGTELLNINGQFDFSSSGKFGYTRIDVVASGSTGDETMDVLVNDSLVASVNVSNVPETYSFETEKFSLQDLKIRFSNDVFQPGYDRNLTVESVQLSEANSGVSQKIFTQQTSVFSNGTWTAQDGIQDGYGRGNTLHGNGYFRFLGKEDRSYDGTKNNMSSNAGAADNVLPRYGNYTPTYGGDGFGESMVDDTSRANARDVSNAVVRGGPLNVSASNLSDFVWLWGQFLDHDLDLSEGSNGPEVNGSYTISINNPNDPLGPRGLPFTRSNFEVDEKGYRQQVNAITSFIDASNVYGSDSERADALRTFAGGKLKTSGNNLLPTEIEVPNEDGGIGNPNLFVAGDVRANENAGLASIHTLFVREHNRLADLIVQEFPEYTDEEIYLLARKIVGAQMQIITYDEFLPTLLGDFAPNANDYVYDSNVDPTIVNSFAHAAYRFGHTMLSPSLQLATSDNQIVGAVALKDAFFNPSFLQEDASRVDLLLQGMLNQRAQEIDVTLVEDVRSFLFGSPGAGGLDLAALNIQRGRDHGIPDYNSLREVYGLRRVSSFAEITSDTHLQNQLASVYADVNSVDAWIGGLAEDHAGNSNMGELFSRIISSQFHRLRDGDRLFYTSDELGLYKNGQLDAAIKRIIDLDNFSLSQVLENNSNVVSDGTPFRSLDGQVLFVNAIGTDSNTEFNVIVDGQSLAGFQANTRRNSYQVIIPDNAQTIRISFINDEFIAGEFDRNLTIESIQVGSSVIQTNSPFVFSTGTWLGSSIEPGFGRGNTLHSNGYFEFSV